VNGCFWHGHENCKYAALPATNRDFWAAKIASNKERDKKEQADLAKMGWSCIVVWQCELKPRVREQTLERLVSTISIKAK
jgi:DNA mismatch endonuclease (patch repair protein)